jgi:hypothetical protein
MPRRYGGARGLARLCALTAQQTLSAFCAFCSSVPRGFESSARTVTFALLHIERNAQKVKIAELRRLCAQASHRF